MLLRTITATFSKVKQYKQIKKVASGIIFKKSYLQNLPQFMFSNASSAEKNFEEEEQNSPNVSNLKLVEDVVADKQLLSKLKKAGYKHLFPIQEKCYSIIHDGLDVLASDRTGSGKTLAYSLPIFQKLKAMKQTSRGPHFLILCPTRQLVIQVKGQLEKINNSFRIVSVYGGDSTYKQKEELRHGAQIIVATPGRLKQFHDEKVINFNNLKTFCIDEADTMLEKGFKLDVENLLANIKNEATSQTQKIMFSATVPYWVETLCREYFSDKLKIVNLVSNSAEKIPAQIVHYGCPTEPHNQMETVLKLIETYSKGGRTIIFSETKHQATKFSEQSNLSTCLLHGDIPQNVRLINLRDFTRGKKDILVATDVASRGLDIPNVELVIHLSPPRNTEPFIHRSGRTGRAGKRGTNIVLYNRQNSVLLKNITKEAKIDLKLITVEKTSKIEEWFEKAESTMEKLTTKDLKPNKIHQLLAEQLIPSQDSKDIVSKMLEHFLPKFPADLMREGKYIKVVIESDKASQIVESIKQQFKLQNLEHKASNSYHFEIEDKDIMSLFTVFQGRDDVTVRLIDFMSNDNLEDYAQSKYSNKNSRYQSKPYHNRERHGSRNQDREQNSSRRYQDNRNKYEETNSSNLSGQDKLFVFNIDSRTRKQDVEEALQDAGVQFSNFDYIEKSRDGTVSRFGFLRLAKKFSGKLIQSSLRTKNGSFISFKPSNN